MTEPRSHGNAGLMPGRYSVLTWTLGWGLMGAALHLSGVFNSPRTGPLWVALAGGALPWAIAGAFTFPAFARSSSNRWKAAGFVIWAVAYLVSFALAAAAGRALADTLGGLVFRLLGWAFGPGAGAFASTWLLADHSRVKTSFIVGGIWTLTFFAGSFIALVGLYIGPELGKLYMGSLIGAAAALTLGSALGCSAGGLAAAAMAVALTLLVR